MNQLRATLLDDAAGVAALESDWRRLWQAQPRREVFTGFDWNMAAWLHGVQRPSVLVVRRGETVVGLLALATGPAGLRFMSGPNADYNDMLVADSDVDAVLALALRTLVESRRRCALDQLPEWSWLARGLDRLPAGLRACIAVQAGPPCPALRLQPDRLAVLDAMVGKKSLKRHDKKLAQLGRVELVHLDTREQIHAALPDFFAQHIARRALAGEPSLFLNDASRQFYRRLVDRFDPAQMLRFAVLRVDDRPVAYHLGFEVEGRFTWYKPSFDVDYWDCGAGEVLLRRLFEYVRGRPVDEFDFTRGGEGFKDRFTNHQGQNMRWTVHGSAASARLMYWHTEARAALKRSARVTAWRNSLRDAGRVLSTWRRGQLVNGAAVMFEASRQSLPAAAADPATTLRRGTLRDLALASVAADALVAPAALHAARERLSSGERLHLAYGAGRLCGIGWLAQGDGTCAAIELLAAPRADVAVLQSLLQQLVHEAEAPTLRLRCPAAARELRAALLRAGWRDAPA